jgi:nitroimidazol reductase NimA-like FMN-containing flavoprotein (pyridoxamine 5'-phosphate oxidase superfamily)
MSRSRGQSDLGQPIAGSSKAFIEKMVAPAQRHPVGNHLNYLYVVVPFLYGSSNGGSRIKIYTAHPNALTVRPRSERKSMQPRMLKNSLTPEEIMEFLENGKVGHLATIGQDGPYVIPINYVLMDGKIYLHCRKAGGEKLDNIMANDRICFEVSKEDGYRTGSTPCQTGTVFKSVIGRGRAKIVENSHPLHQAALLKFASIFAPHIDKPVIPEDKAALTAVIELTIDVWTGKRSK